MASVPEDYGEKAKLERLSYTSVTEMLGERFHMDEAYLKALNPEANFNRVGTVVRVANIGPPSTGKVARIIADKGRSRCWAYDADGKLVAAYPATIGSSDTPSPTGTHAVSRVAFNPEYTYNPEGEFQAGRQRQGADDPARSERTGRLDLDRARQADLRHSRHARTIEDRQDRKPWLRAPDQLGRRGTGQDGHGRRDGGVLE